MDEKIRQDYTVAVQSNNKITGEEIRTPMVTNRRIISLNKAVELMTESGFMRGQTEDLKGTANGFFQGLQYLAKQGYTIDCSDWIRVSGNLRGQVGADGVLTSANSYRITVTALKELTVPISEFNWHNIGAAVKIPRIDFVIGDATGAKRGEIVKTAAILLNGNNFIEDGATASVKFVWDGGEETAGEVTTAAETLLVVAAQSALAQLPSGTEVDVTVIKTIDGKSFSSKAKSVVIA